VVVGHGSVLDAPTVTTAPGRARQEEIYRDGVSGRRPRVPTAPAERERRGRRAMGRAADAYVSGGAGAEATMRADRAAYARYEIVPRVLRGSAERDLSVDLFGRRLAAPVLLSPIGALDLVRRDADLAVARGAAAAGVPMIVSNQAGSPLEAIAAAGGASPLAELDLTVGLAGARTPAEVEVRSRR